MKFEKLKRRLDPNRPAKEILLRIPIDVIEDLARLAQLRGFSTPEALARAYIGQGLRTDLERIDSEPITALVESLKRHGVSEEVISEALQESVQR